MWTDSKCVLLWLQSQAQLAVFVENRIKELRRESEVQFRHVRSEENPADHITRGLTPTEIADSDQWWHGPHWLKEYQSKWPSDVTTLVTPDVLDAVQQEKRSHLVHHVTVASEDSSQDMDRGLLGIDITRFSSLQHLLRITSLCLKFVVKLFNKTQRRTRITANRHSPLLSFVFTTLSTGLPVNSNDLQLAKTLWTYHEQQSHFADVLSAIQTNSQHCLVKQLGLQADDLGIIRCHGRFEHADLTHNAAMPKLLPR